MKKCTKCRIEKSLSEFQRDSKINGVRPQCKECSRVYEATRSLSVHRKEARRKSKLKREYNLTLEEYSNMLKNQNGVCAICGLVENNGNSNLHIDHNHITGEIRGLLCSSCNTGIGLLKDDVTILIKAASYLKQSGLSEL